VKIKIKRRLRTATSEQWALFNLDTIDDSGQPESAGKIDIHYDEEMVFLTVLLWSEFTASLDEAAVQSIIDELVDEVTEPVGVPAEYSLDFFTPSFADYKFLTNYEDDDDDDDDDDEEWDEDSDGQPGERNGNSPWK
jgi:hypothetical protein